MSIAVRVILSFTVIIGLVLGMCAVNFISAKNAGNAAVNQIEATWNNNQNILSSAALQVKDAAKVTNMQREAVTKLVSEAMQGRYGEMGSQAQMQWIQEQLPNLDQSTYIKLQQIIQATRTEFQTAQTKLIDQKRAFKTDMGTFWTGFWLGAAGYTLESVNLDQYNVVISAQAQETFKTGEDQSFLP